MHLNLITLPARTCFLIQWDHWCQVHKLVFGVFFSNFSCRFQSFPNWLHCFCRRKIQFVAAQNASPTAEECSTTTPPSGVAMLRWMLAKRLRPPWVAPRSEPPGITGHHRAPGFEGWYLSKEGNIRLWKWGITFITTIYPNMVRNLVANLDGCGVAFFKSRHETYHLLRVPGFGSPNFSEGHVSDRCYQWS